MKIKSNYGSYFSESTIKEMGDRILHYIKSDEAERIEIYLNLIFCNFHSKNIDVEHTNGYTQIKAIYRIKRGKITTITEHYIIWTIDFNEIRKDKIKYILKEEN